MSLTTNTRLGPYEVLALVGAGGMGEVYSARDTRLDRHVAIKVLGASALEDTRRLDRLLLEARAISRLNHPHICTLFDVSQEAGVTFLVMELLEGKTLADELARGPLPIDRAIGFGLQIAAALDAAHSRGVIHRDLKPGNVMITANGVKLLDFGLAKLHEPDEGPAGLIATREAGPTEEGAILGTYPYMSPEQLEGGKADARSDIFAFGVLLYEMATGRRPFRADNRAALTAAILTENPPPVSTICAAPPLLDRVIARCLEKDPEARWQSVRDLAAALHWTTVQPGTLPVGSRWLTWRALVATGGIALLVAAAYVAGGARSVRSTSPVSAPELRLHVMLPPSASADTFSLSPDGTNLVFQADDKLWLRSLQSESAVVLPGTEGATGLAGPPFWSPDGKSVGFFTIDQVKRIDLATHLVQPLGRAPYGIGGTWSRDGIIVFSPGPSSTLIRVGASGRDPIAATTLTAGQVGHRFPQFLPDGRHFLFMVVGSAEQRGVYVGSLDSPDTRRLLQTDARAVFAPPDLLLFSESGALLAQRLNLDTLALVGEPTPVAAPVFVNSSTFNAVAVSPSAVGPIAYRAHAGSAQLRWVDRSGNPLENLGESDRGTPWAHRLSPDNQTVAVRRTVNGNADIFLVDVRRGVPRRFTLEPIRDTHPIWSPDGRRLVFGSERTGVFDFFERAADGTGPERLVFSSPETKLAVDWSADSKFILYTSLNPNSDRDVMAFSMTGSPTPIKVAASEFDERDARFSPDGRWVAYSSDESGSPEVVVQPFPGPGRVVPISHGGGDFPEWRVDGRELFYIAPGGRLMAVPITLRPSIEVGTPRALFSSQVQSRFAVARDGQRFLVYTTAEEGAPITILLNWTGFTR